MKTIIIVLIGATLCNAIAIIDQLRERRSIDEPNSNLNQTNSCYEFPGFTSVNARDSYSFDISNKSEYVMIYDMSKAADYCSNCLACEGFNTYGWIKWHIVAEDYLIDMENTFCLYIKDSIPNEMKQKWNPLAFSSKDDDQTCPKETKLNYFISQLINLIEFKRWENIQHQSIYGSKDLIEFHGYNSEYDSLRLVFEGHDENIIIKGLKFGRYAIQHHSDIEYATVHMQDPIIFELSDVRHAFFRSVQNGNEHIFLTANSEEILEKLQQFGYYIIKYLNTSKGEKTGVMSIK